jgi:FkbM family methyltransferase
MIPVSVLPPRTVVVDGIFGPLIAFENDFATEQITRFGAHTRNEIALLRRFIDKGDLVYDIGAHIGGFAVPFALDVGEEGRVVCVEARADSFSLLWQNLYARGVTGRTAAINGLVGGKAGRYQPRSSDNHTSATYFVPDPGGEAVITLTLDNLHACFGGNGRAALIKIDVEGMELGVLRSGAQMIGRDRPIVYVEIVAEQLARYGTTHADIEAFLRPLGYRFFRNVGERNSTNDTFKLVELQNLAAGGSFYDVLAVSKDSSRLERAEAAVAEAIARV